MQHSCISLKAPPLQWSDLNRNGVNKGGHRTWKLRNFVWKNGLEHDRREWWKQAHCFQRKALPSGRLQFILDMHCPVRACPHPFSHPWLARLHMVLSGVAAAACGYIDLSLVNNSFSFPSVRTRLSPPNGERTLTWGFVPISTLENR